MTSSSSVTLRWPVVVLVATLLLAIGAAATLLLGPRGQHPASPPVPNPPAAPLSSDPSAADVQIHLSPAVAANARLETAVVSRMDDSREIQVPGTVVANAYSQTSVAAVTSGRVSRVFVQLGERVPRDATLAEIYSPELADAETAFLSMQADFGSVHQELLRTERLAAIGSASAQELEKARAEHTRHATGIESARARLTLFGLTAAAITALERSSEINATLRVVAPSAGEVTARGINEGAAVTAGAALFTITDLSTVWVIANVYENDMQRIRTGAAATVALPSAPANAIGGHVTYLDPEVSPATRTGQVRVEVPNRRGQLRIAMYVAVTIAAGGSVSALGVPSAAIQQIGNQQVVYVTGADANVFTERAVVTGPERVGLVPVAGALTEGDRVVTFGSFLLRSERERLGLRPPSLPQQAPPKASQRREISVTSKGFSPAEITVEKNTAVELVFLRTTDDTCAKKVVFPGLKTTKELPLNTPVSVAWTPDRSGTVEFVCGMNMFKGAVVVK